MNRIAQFITDNRRLSWLSALLVSMGVGLCVWWFIQDYRERERLSILQLEARRNALEILSKTINGNLMGATSLLGLIDDAIKQEARGDLPPNGDSVTRLLKSIARTGDADGAFVVGKDGIITSSFGVGKSSTGAVVGFRPYYKAARAGKESVYAAVGTTTGRRTLYVAAPLYDGETTDTPTIGAVVARGSLEPIDKLLTGKTDIALLTSPQQVVFAGNRPDWIGHLATKPTPELLQEIRKHKQFGAMFENKEPAVLPITPDKDRVFLNGRKFVVASARMQWNDPLGDWKLTLMEDLAGSAPAESSIMIGIGAATGSFMFCMALLHVFRSRYAQSVAARQIEAFTRKQQIMTERKAQLTDAAIHLQQKESAEDVAQAFLAVTHDLFAALQGAVYVAGDSPAEHMRLAAGYARGETLKSELIPGEGLLGECALAREMKIIETPVDGPWIIQSGLGKTRPAAVMMAPVVLHDTLLGAVEIAVLNSPDAEDRQQFEELVKILGLNLTIMKRKDGVRDGTLQHQSEARQ